MIPFDRPPMTSYWRYIVTMALSGVVSETFNVEKYRDLEIPEKGQSRSLKVVPFDSRGMVSYLCSIVTLSLRHL